MVESSGLENRPDLTRKINPTRVPFRRWMQLLDGVAMLLLVLIVWAVAFDGLRLEILGIRIRATGVGRLVAELAVVVAIRHWLVPRPTILDLARSWTESVASRLRTGELRRRARVLAFPVLLGPLQILLFGAYTIYRGNADEFSAPFWRLAVHSLPALAVIVAGLIGLGFVISESWFRRYVVALFGFGVLTWLQGGVLVANYGAFTGEALNWEQHAWRGPYEIGLWVVGLSAMIAASRRVLAVAPFASQLLIALQTLLLVASVVQSRSQRDRGVLRPAGLRLRALADPQRDSRRVGRVSVGRLS